MGGGLRGGGSVAGLLLAAIGRFPAAMAASLAAAVVVNLPGSIPPWHAGLAASFAWALAIRLLLESRIGTPGLLRAAAPWVALALVPLPWLAGLGVAATILLPASGLLAAVAAPTLGRGALRSAVEAEWARAFLWAVVRACAIVLPLCGGLSLLALAVDALFGTELRADAAIAIWQVGGLLVLPWWTLALLPRLDPAAGVPPLPRAPALLLDLLLAPLALAYAALLNGYCLFILVRGELPKGVVGPIVLGFALVGGAIWSLTFGDRRPGLATRILRCGLLPALVAPAVALLLAGWQRVGQHGGTEQRYLILLAGVLLLAFAAAQLVTRRIPPPSRLALVAAAALLAVSIGPWGVTAVAVRSQLDRLEQLLDRTGHLRDGVATALGPAVPRDAGLEILDSLQYLVERGQRQAIIDRFRLHPGAGGLDRQSAAAQALSLALAMGVGTDSWQGAPPLDWRAASDTTVPVAGFDHLLRQRLDAGGVRNVDLPGATLRLELSASGRTFFVSRNGTLLWRFDLRPLLRDFSPLHPPADLDAVAADGTRLRLSLQRASILPSSGELPQLGRAEIFLLVGGGGAGPDAGAR